MSYLRKALMAGAFLGFVLMSTPAVGRAGSTHSSEQHAWASTLSRFAQTLGAGDETQVFGQLTDQHTIRFLDGKTATVSDLVRLTHSPAWVKELAYAKMPDQLASDIASAVADEKLDANLRNYLTPRNALGARNADVTAIKWLASVLAPRADQAVGVILVFRPADASVHAPAKLTIVLTSGEYVGSRLYRVRNITFGQFEIAGR